VDRGGLRVPGATLAAEGLGGFRGVDTDSGGAANVERWGAYAYAQYDVNRRWAAGLRGDWTELPVERGREWALSPYVQFKPSEFLRFRLQYKHTEGRGAVERSAERAVLARKLHPGRASQERF